MSKPIWIEAELVFAMDEKALCEFMRANSKRTRT